MSFSNSKITWTKTDEAPMLATHSLYPIVKAFLGAGGVSIEMKDISLAARILSAFPEYLNENQRIPDALAELGNLVLQPEANIIKLPNISASVPQLKEAIQELQSKGFPIPDLVEKPKTEEEKIIFSKYNKIKGSAVNPVLREGNSDRRAPKAVKMFAKNNPHSMGTWSKDSKTHVATMQNGDFKSNEKSKTFDSTTSLTIEHISKEGVSTILKDNLAIKEGEIADATVMSKSKLIEFLDAQISEAKSQNIMLSLHMKATMMKVSDPVIFGLAVKSFFKNVFEKYGTDLDAIGVDVNNGFGDVISKLEKLPEDKKVLIQQEIDAAFQNGPALAMVDSDKGITNLHVPSDVIIDASMPAMIRNSGKMWDANGNPQDTKAVIPDSSYAGLYQVVIDFCRENGAFDPTTMGSVPNVGLMAQKAEEYGSHDKTFKISSSGKVVVKDSKGNVVFEHVVEEGDIWRMCQTKDEPIQNWVKLAVKRARATQVPAIFWLDSERGHDREMIAKVKKYLALEDTENLEIKILSPEDACRYTLERIVKGEDTISVTGNVLRDYLTDLFPILELGTSAKMLSIVPLMKGGGLFETGAGGSAPKHVEQFVAEGHLRWDSLGEFMALAPSLEHYSEFTHNTKAGVLATTLDDAITLLLINNKGPKRKAGEPDNKVSHYYLAMYWAQELAKQNEDAELKSKFSPIALELESKESEILNELISKGKPVDIKGYYYPSSDAINSVMRSSQLFNSIIDAI